MPVPGADLPRRARQVRHDTAQAGAAVVARATSAGASFSAARPLRRLGRAWSQRGTMLFFIGLALGVFAMLMQLSVSALYEEEPHAPIAMLLHWGVEPRIILVGLWMPPSQSYADPLRWVAFAAACLAF